MHNMLFSLAIAGAWCYILCMWMLLLHIIYLRISLCVNTCFYKGHWRRWESGRRGGWTSIFYSACTWNWIWVPCSGFNHHLIRGVSTKLWQYFVFIRHCHVVEHIERLSELFSIKRLWNSRDKQVTQCKSYSSIPDTASSTALIMECLWLWEQQKMAPMTKI